MADGQAQAQQQPLIQGQPQLQVQVDPAVQAFQNLRVELANVTQALTEQGISSIVNKFDGNPKTFVNGLNPLKNTLYLSMQMKTLKR